MVTRKFPQRGSLVFKLTVRLVATTVALATALVLLLMYEFQSDINTIRDRTLTSQARDIARLIEPGADGKLSIDLPAELKNVYSDPDSGYLFQVRSAAGDLLFSSAGGAPVLDETEPHSRGVLEFFMIKRPHGPRYHAASVPVSGQFGELLIRVGQSDQHADVMIDEVLEEFVSHVGWWLPAILALFLIVNIVTVRRSLAPIETISRMAAGIGPTDTEIKLPETRLPEEIRPLVRAVNSTFERLSKALRTQRDFTADAAHELRTPLAVINMKIDTSEDDADKLDLKRDLTAMARIVEQLLKVAQLDAFVLDVNERANLCTVVTDVACRLGHLAIERKKTISVVVPDTPIFVRGDSAVLDHAVTNLVENALAHTPEGKGVEIIVEQDGTIHVDDEGTGIHEDERELVFRRFWRKDRSTSGAGIGLSIVAKIAEAHNSTVQVSRSPGGGARFTLSLHVCTPPRQ